MNSKKIHLKQFFYLLITILCCGSLVLTDPDKPKQSQKTDTREYVTRELNGDYEITSLMGNISTMDGKSYLHLHVNLSDETYQTFGGHLTSAVVSGTCEIIIDQIHGKMDREFSQEIGLNLFKF